MKRFNICLGIFAVILLVAVLWSGGVNPAAVKVASAADYTLVVTPLADGDGSSSTPYTPASAIPDAEVRVLSFFRFIHTRLATTNCSGEYYLLNENIDLSQTTGFTPIGDGQAYIFAGNFSATTGSGASAVSYTISNLAIGEGLDGTGLFATLDGATVTGVTLNGCSSTGYVGVGMIAGAADGVTLENVSIIGCTVSSVGSAGGVFGTATNTVIENATVTSLTASVTANKLGAAVGNFVDSSLTNVSVSSSTLSTDSGDEVGGLVGYASGSSVLNSSVSIDTHVSGDESVGGTVGHFADGTLAGTRTGAAVTGAYMVGGIVGNATMQADLTINNSYSVSAVYKASLGNEFNYIAGLIGYYASENSERLSLTNCYFAGLISEPNVSGYGGMFGVNTHLSSPNTQNVTATACFYAEEAFGNSTLTSRAFPNATTADKAIYRSIPSGSATEFSSYVGWDFDAIWMINTNSNATGFGKYPDFVRYWSDITKVTINSVGDQTAADVLAYCGLVEGASYNVPTNAPFHMDFAPPTGYEVVTLTVSMGDNSIENNRNLVGSSRADATFSATTNSLRVTSVTSAATISFQVDSDNYNFIFMFRDYVSENSGDFRGSTVSTADDEWTPSAFDTNFYYNSYKYADEFRLKYNSGTVNSIRNVYRLSSVVFGGVAYDVTALWTSDSTELTGTLIFNVAAMATRTDLTYRRLDETDEDETPSYIYIELVWEARECTVKQNAPQLDGASSSSTNFGTVTITGNSVEGKYYMGETITFTATPAKNADGTDGYVFLEWQSNTGNGYSSLADTPAQFSVTLSPDVSVIDITARFRRLWDISVAVSGEEGGVRIATDADNLDLDEYITATYHISDYGDLLTTMSAISDIAARESLYESSKEYYNEEHTAAAYTIKLPNLLSVDFTMDYLVDTVCSLSYGASTTTYRYNTATPNAVASGTLRAQSGYSVVTVTFTEITYSLTVSAKNSAQGSVYVDGGATNFAKNGVATIMVTAMAHYRFSHWERVPENGVGQVFNTSNSGGVLFDEFSSGVNYSCKITMTADLVLRAVFVRTYGVTMSVARTGGNIAARLVSSGGTMVETVTYDGIESGASVEFNLRVYEGYVIKTASNNNSSVVSNFLASGTGTELLGGVDTTYQSYVFTMADITADAAINVTFSLATYSLIVSSANSAYGSVTGSGTYAHNSTAYVTATAASGYEFVGWVQDRSTVYNADGTLSSNIVYWSRVSSSSIIMRKATSLTAVFTRAVEVSAIEYSLKVVKNTGISGVGIYVGSQPKTSPSTLTTGTSVTIRANVEAGYTFLGWYPEGFTLSSTPATSKSSSYTFVLGADTTLVAVASQDVYTVLINEANCLITVEGRSTQVSTAGKTLSCTYGENLTFLCTPDPDYTVSGWVKNGEIFVTQSTKHSVTVTGDLTVGTTMNTSVSSTTDDSTHTAQIVVSSNNVGMGYASGGGNIAVGSSSVIYANPVAGYKFLYWTDSDGKVVSTDQSLLVTSSDDTAYIAVFDVDRNSIIKTFNEAGGTITGADELAYLESSEMVITPERGYQIASLLVNGSYIQLTEEQQANGYTFTLTGTGANQTVTVAFERTGATVLIIGLASAGAGLIIILIAIIVVSARKRSARKI